MNFRPLSALRFSITALLFLTAALGFSEEKPTKETELPGILISRSNGQFMTLNIDSNRFILRFFDAKKKPISADVASGHLTYSSSTTRERRDFLSASEDGQSLRGRDIVARPYVFRVRLALVKKPSAEATAETETKAETYSVQVNLPANEPPETVSIYELDPAQLAPKSK